MTSNLRNLRNRIAGLSLHHEGGTGSGASVMVDAILFRDAVLDLIDEALQDETTTEYPSIDALIALGDNFILPIDVTIGAGTFRKGVKVGTMLRCLKNHAQYAAATPYEPGDLKAAFAALHEAATDDEPCTECNGTGWDRMRERECDCVAEPAEQVKTPCSDALRTDDDPLKPFPRTSPP